MKFLKAFRFALGMVDIAEQIVPVSGQGAKKLEFVMQAAGAAYQDQADIRAAWGDPAAFAAAVARAVPLIVSVKNATGMFQTSK